MSNNKLDPATEALIAGLRNMGLSTTATAADMLEDALRSLSEIQELTMSTSRPMADRLEDIYVITKGDQV